MKRIINLFCILSLVITVFYSRMANVQAASAPPSFGGSYVNGVSNITVYIDYASGSGYWENYIKGAVNNWMYPGSGMSNPIYMKYVSSSTNGSNIDIYTESNNFWENRVPSGAIVYAETMFFRKSVRLYPSSSNTVSWTYAEIHINNDNFRRSSFTNDQAQGTMIHEMGHCFGLGENNSNPNSIMCQTGSGRRVQRVQEIDNNVIKAKYR